MKKWWIVVLMLISVLPTTLGQDVDEEDEWDEDSEKGWSLTLNMGAYIGGKKSANIYNGSCLFDISNDPNGVRCYSIWERLNLNINDVQYITNFYGIQSFELPYDAYPTNMNYQPAFMYGVNIMYDFNWANALIIDMNLMKIKAVNQFTLRFVGGPIQQNAQQDIRLFTITGEEQRFNLNLGYRSRMEINPTTNWYFDFGGSMLGAKLEKNTIRVADRDFQLILGADNPNQFVQYRPKTSVGFGFFGGTGVEFSFNEDYRMEAGIIVAREKIILQSFEAKVVNWSLLLRFGF